MILSRRDFLNICKTSSLALGLSALDVIKLEELLANPNAPTILWLQGSGCTGCTVSFLNYVSPVKPVDIADLLINNVNLAYHNTAMAAVADTGIEVLDAAYAKGGYILAVEGGVPTAFGGHACIAWSRDGREVTFLDAVKTLAGRASSILSIGTCASWGGIPAAPPNPTAVRGGDSHRQAHLQHRRVPSTSGLDCLDCSQSPARNGGRTRRQRAPQAIVPEACSREVPQKRKGKSPNLRPRRALS